MWVTLASSLPVRINRVFSKPGHTVQVVKPDSCLNETQRKRWSNRRIKTVEGFGDGGEVPAGGI